MNLNQAGNFLKRSIGDLFAPHALFYPGNPLWQYERQDKQIPWQAPARVSVRD
jgi:hypothetical protein